MALRLFGERAELFLALTGVLHSRVFPVIFANSIEPTSKKFLD